MNDNIITLKTNHRCLEQIYTTMIDKKFIAGWYVEEDDNYRSIIIHTSFGDVLSLVFVPMPEEYNTEWAQTIGKDRIQAFEHNLCVLQNINN